MRRRKKRQWVIGRLLQLVVCWLYLRTGAAPASSVAVVGKVGAAATASRRKMVRRRHPRRRGIRSRRRNSRRIGQSVRLVFEKSAVISLTLPGTHVSRRPWQERQRRLRRMVSLRYWLWMVLQRSSCRARASVAATYSSAAAGKHQGRQSTGERSNRDREER